MFAILKKNCKFKYIETILTSASHSGHPGFGVVGIVGIGVVVVQESVVLCISQVSEQIIVRHIFAPRSFLSNIISPEREIE